MGFFDFLDDVSGTIGKVGDIVSTGSEIIGNIKGGGSGGSSAPNIFLPPGYSPATGGLPSVVGGPGGGFNVNGSTLLIAAAAAVGLWLVLRRR